MRRIKWRVVGEDLLGTLGVLTCWIWVPAVFIAAPFVLLFKRWTEVKL